MEWHAIKQPIRLSVVKMDFYSFLSITHRHKHALTCSYKVSDTGPLSHLFGCSYSFLFHSKILTNRDLSYINDRVPGVLSVSSPVHNEGSSLFGELCKVYASISICPPRWVSTLSSQENRTIFFLLHKALHFMTEHLKNINFSI